jgi:glycosyltransferase involved in cell wall biosynthesis
MSDPIVTVICVCYNHEKYLEEAVASVLNQTYKNIQIIIVDDSSADRSVDKIRELSAAHSQIELVLLPQNHGYCRAFNKSLPLVKGEYFIDFATDDIMMPDRIEKQVRKFQSLDGSYGVVFTDAIYIDQRGFELRHHFDYLLAKGLIHEVPQGYIYKELVSRYFIPAPTMMSRTQVIEDLKGYDENLSFEDFDYWVRSSIRYQYAFLNEKLTKIRKSKTSMSAALYKAGDQQLRSTYLVCKKAQVLNRTDEEKEALVERVKYELRHSVFTSNYEEAACFYILLGELNGIDWKYNLLIRLSKLRLPLPLLRKLYHFVRYRG